MPKTFAHALQQPIILVFRTATSMICFSIQATPSTCIQPEATRIPSLYHPTCRPYPEPVTFEAIKAHQAHQAQLSIDLFGTRTRSSPRPRSSPLLLPSQSFQHDMQLIPFSVRSPLAPTLRLTKISLTLAGRLPNPRSGNAHQTW